MAVEASTPLGSGRAATAVTSAIRNAANATGTSFGYLLATAKIESDLDPNLTMKSSSATGLFQFIDQTWLGTFKQAGPAFGYGDYANAISRNSSGHYCVDDPEMRHEIMKLRNDPTANAVMAGVLTQQNAAALIRRIGRQPTESELYIAHFFGAGGAGKLIELAANNPQANAAETFPLAAQANRPIFYDRQGNASSARGRLFGARPPLQGRERRRGRDAGGRRASDAAGCAVGAAGRAGETVGDRRRGRHQVLPPLLRPLRRRAPARGSRQRLAPLSTAQMAPTFNSLFSDQDRRTAVDPLVAALWSAPASPPQPAAASAPPPPAVDPNSTGSGVVRSVRGQFARMRARCSAAAPDLNTSSINHKIYGERFVKARVLACLLSGMSPELGLVGSSS